MGIKVSKEQTAERDAFIVEKFKENPKLGITAMKKLCREKFGFGIEFYKARNLKKEALKKEAKPKNPFKQKANLKSVKTNGHACPKELRPVMKELTSAMRAMQFSSIAIDLGENGPQITFEERRKYIVPGPE